MRGDGSRDLGAGGSEFPAEGDTLVSYVEQLPSRRDPSLSHCPGGVGREEIASHPDILYPHGHREHWFTDQVFKPDDLTRRYEELLGALAGDRTIFSKKRKEDGAPSAEGGNR